MQRAISMEQSAAYQQFVIPGRNQQVVLVNSFFEFRREKARELFPVESLMEQSNNLMEQLSAESMTAFYQQTTQVEYAYFHSHLSARAFLTRYFTEANQKMDLMSRFHVARWSEKFDQQDLYAAFIDAYIVCHVMYFWDTQGLAVKH